MVLSDEALQKVVKHAENKIGGGFSLYSIKRKVWDDLSRATQEEQLSYVEMPIETYEVIIRKGDKEIAYLVSSMGEIKYLGEGN